MRLNPPKARYVKVLIQEFEGDGRLVEPNMHLMGRMLILYETNPEEVEQGLIRYLKTSGMLEKTRKRRRRRL
jgi:hypothetical protein